MCGEGVYAIQFDDSSGRAYVNVQGEFDAHKIRNTFAVIVLNKKWSDGDRTVLWRLNQASLPQSFEFANIFQTAKLSIAIIKPGKSAIVVDKSSDMIRRVARFYQGIALSSTPRKIEIFYDEDEAVAWLDEEPET
jgi:hypothetical protein